MSPEQIRGKPLDGRTDTWSLAVVAFLMLAGELPFQGNGPHDVAEKILRGERLRLAAVAPHHPDALDRVFDRAFSVDRELRFGSATEFAGALEAATRASAPAVADDAESSGAVTARNPEPRADFAAAETAPQAARALQSPQRELAIDDVRAPTVASEPIEVVAPTEGRRAFRGTMRMDAGQVAAAARASAGAAPATAEPTQGVAPTVGTPAWVEQGPGGPGAQEITLEPTSRKAEQGKRSRAAAAVVVAIAVGGLVVFGVLLLRAGALQPHLAGATVKSGEVPAARPDGEGKAPSATTAGSTAGTSTSGGAPSASSAATERRSGSAAATASAAPALTGKLPTQARAPTATATALPLGL